MVAMDQRVFQGKENLIECIALLTLQSDSEALKVESIHILTQEATKGGAAYKIKVLAALLEICENIKIDSRTQVQGKYNTVYDIQYIIETTVDCVVELLGNPLKCLETEALLDLMTKWDAINAQTRENISSKLS